MLNNLNFFNSRYNFFMNMRSIIQKLALFVILAIVGVGVFIWFYKPGLITVFFQNTDYSRSLYQQARELQQNNDFKAAYYTYGRISPRYRAYDVVLFQQANCAAAIEDEKTAINKYQKLLKDFPESKLVPLASYNLGQAHIRYNKPVEAEKQFLRTMENYPGTDYALGSFYYLGELNKNKNKDLAARYWLKYIALAPGGRFSPVSLEGLKSLNYQFSQKDKLHAGIALFMHQEHKKALEYLSQLPEKEAWYYRAMSLKAIGQRTKALALLKNALRNYLDEQTSPFKIRNAMQSYVQLSYNSKYRSWSHILDWTDKERDYALYQKAQRLSLKKGKKLYEEIFEKYPYGNFASESLWNLFWLEYDDGDFDDAIKLGGKHIELFENTLASPAVNFWMGKIYEHSKNTKKAQNFYSAVVKKFPDSYYAFRSDGRLMAIKGQVDPGWKTDIANQLPSEDIQVNIPYSYSEISRKHSVQAAEMLLLSDLETALLFIENEPFLESWIKFKNGIVTNSIVTARNAMQTLIKRPGAIDSRWKLIYPLYYQSQINVNATKNKLDPLIVISLMKEESHFNPYATSSSNAQGLMQVLPCTASDISRWKGLGSNCSIKLFDPDENIKVGTAYLGYTRDIFDGDMMYAVAAYNAGPAAVQTWIKRTSYPDRDRFVENIAYKQTRDYVKKVFGSYWNYKRLYGFN